MGADVVVVGAGPVGLMLAGELKLGGADVVLYDKLPALTGESRALGFNRRTAESFDQRGLLTRLGKFRWGQASQFGGVRIDLAILDEAQNGVLGLSQATTESMLANWLAELGVPVRYGHEAVGLTQDADGVVVTFNGPDGRHEVSADYVVGSDGGQSTIRELVAVPTQGWESTRGMYTAEITGVELRQRPIGERLPGGNMIVCTNLGGDRYRIVIHDGTLPPNPDSGSLTFAAVADAWQRLTGESVQHAKPLWIWATGNGARLAEQYRRGRVLLVGDAAHDTPPLAAWGISAGIQDAVNLGWKLAAVVTGRGDDALLDSYHDERYPVGQLFMRNVQAAWKLYLGGDEMGPLREVVGELVASKGAAEHLAGIVSGLGVRYDMGSGDHPLLGKRMPPGATLVKPDGSRVSVAELLHKAHGVLISTVPSSEATRLAGDRADRVDVVTGQWDDNPGLPDEVLIRPDGYVAWTADGSGDLAGSLTRWFGAARTSATAPA